MEVIGVPCNSDALLVYDPLSNSSVGVPTNYHATGPFKWLCAVAFQGRVNFDIYSDGDVRLPLAAINWFLVWPLPIGSMYAIYGNIYHQYTPNVTIYTIHGSYGLRYHFACVFGLRVPTPLPARNPERHAVCHPMPRWLHPDLWSFQQSAVACGHQSCLLVELWGCSVHHVQWPFHQPELEVPTIYYIHQYYMFFLLAVRLACLSTKFCFGPF